MAASAITVSESIAKKSPAPGRMLTKHKRTMMNTNTTIAVPMCSALRLISVLHLPQFLYPVDELESSGEILRIHRGLEELNVG